MAKAQTIKPKSSIGDWLKRFTGGSKQKPTARPGVSGQSSTLTNIAAGPAMRPGTQKDKALSSTGVKKPKPARDAGSRLASLRVPFIGGKPFLAQMKILPFRAPFLFVATGPLRAHQTNTRTHQ